PPVAVALGASVVEKHLTMDRGLKGSDHACSLEPDELRRMIGNIRDVEAAMGRDDKPVPDDTRGVKDRLGRSLVTKVALPAGALVQESMLTLKCPGDGVPWPKRGRVIGRRVRRDVAADEKIREEDLV
ncbi:MAG: N-acetylneuraminate synthase family protein, partial [Planctomycetales bacterium]